MIPTQEQVEAMIRLMLYARYQDRSLSVAEDDEMKKRISDMPWRSGESVALFVNRATAEVRKAREDATSSSAFLAAQQEALVDAEARRYALKQVTALLQSDGMQPEETELLERLRGMLG